MIEDELFDEDIEENECQTNIEGKTIQWFRIDRSHREFVDF